MTEMGEMVDAEPKLTIVVGSDAAGYEYKKALREQFEADERVAAVIDVGVDQDGATYYSSVAIEAAEIVAAGHADRGLLICGTGLGVAIAANKVRGIRAVTAHDSYSVERSVKSNNAQILCLGQRVIGIELARRLATEWLSYHFDQQSMSAQKIGVIERYEAESDQESC